MTDDVLRSIDTVVIGAGQAGILMSWHLQLAGRDHVVLDRRETLGGGWQDRWDGFRLVSPNWTSGLPGFPYDDPDPDGFMPRDAMVARVARYAEVVGAPVARSTEVTRLGPDGAAGRRFRLETNRGPIDTDAVILAVGAFHRPRIPGLAAGLSPRITQLHAHDYRRPDQLPPGGVLLVGSGQTGVQLAEELQAAGRSVVIATGRCGRGPRRFRGRDYFWWVRQLAERGDAVGAPLPSVDEFAEPRLRFACNPHLSGHGGGHETNLRQMALDGVRLTGRLTGADGERVTFARDLADNLRFADAYFDQRFTPIIERFAARTGLDLEPDDRRWPTYEPPEVEAMDLAAEGITTVLWTTGYAPDYGWLDFPILDVFGVPRQVAGQTEVPGLTCLGQLWQRNAASANLAGVHVDAALLAAGW